MNKKVPGVVYLGHYSGDRSVAFWDAINATKDRTLYDFACALQEIESRVLGVLNTTKRKASHDRCWCSLDQPCHADVLLELANAERPAGLVPGEKEQP